MIPTIASVLGDLRDALGFKPGESPVSVFARALVDPVNRVLAKATTRGLVFTSGTSNEPVTLAFSSSIDTDASLSNTFDITATGNFTLENPTRLTDGQAIKWRVRQGGAGSNVPTLGTKFRMPSSASALTWSTTAGDMDLLAVLYNEADDKLDVVSFVPGY